MRAATEKELADFPLTREREDLEKLCSTLEALSTVLSDMRHRKTDFVIQDRLENELGNIEEYVDEQLDALWREAKHRITELNGA